MNSLKLLVVGRSGLSNEFMRGLPRGGVIVETAANVTGAARSLESCQPDLIVSDIRLPDGNALDALPGWASIAPVILVAAEASASERVRAFELGAEDFVSTPVVDEEMALRMEKAVARWKRLHPGSVVRFMDLALDPGARVLSREGGGSVCLSVSERSLLELLLASPGRVASRREIAKRCLRVAYHETSRAPDMLASKLRAKLRELGASAAIETLRGEGYRLRLGEPATDLA